MYKYRIFVLVCTEYHQQIEVLLFSIILFINILYTLFAIILYYFSILIIFLAVSRLLFPIIFILIIFLAVSRLLFPIIFSKGWTIIRTSLFYGINYCYYCNYFSIILIILFSIILIICFGDMLFIIIYFQFY